jgi:hypothetical protein
MSWWSAEIAALLQRARSLTVTLLALVAWTVSTASAGAQNYSFDERTIALGGVGSGSGNIAASLIDEQKPYRSIVIPLGLVQVLKDFDKFNPDSDLFDPVRAGEYAASPIHFVVGRDGTSTGNFFVTDIRNGELSRDLNVYEGFVPAPELVAEGLANPSWGKTFKFGQTDGDFQGIYAGAGPYFSMQTRALVDENLRSILGSDAPVFIPNSRFHVTDTTDTQLALAITGGYRARLPVWGWVGELDGIYLAANYNYLKGFRYESFDTALRLDTDGVGLLTVNPLLPAPLRVTRNSAEDGRGFAIDVGAGIVVDRWQFGFGANGLGNRIEWSGLEHTLCSLDTLFNGDGDFDDTTLPPVVTDIRVELPVDYRGYLAYSTDAWGGTAEWSNGFQGTTFRAGLEKKFRRIELRGGGRFVRDRREPSRGVGLNLSDRFGIDVAGFGTSANVQRERKLAIAISLRLMHRNQP